MFVKKKCIRYGYLLCVVSGFRLVGMGPFAADHVVTSFTEVQELFDKATPDSLVVLDIDRTISEPLDATLRIGTTQNVEDFSDKNESITAIYGDFLEGIERKPKGFFVRAVLNSLEQHLVEPVIADIVADLQQRRVPVVALSAFCAGQSKDVPEGSIQESRYQKMRRLGIDLSTSFDFQERFFLPDDDWWVSSVRYYKGLISTASRAKGTTLWAFMESLKKEGRMPLEVIFADDAHVNIESVKKELCRRAIPVTTILYEASTHRASEEVIDSVVAKAQYDYILAHDAYISYADAAKLVSGAEKG